MFNGEDLRVFQLAKHLSARHRIDLLCYGEDSPVPGAIKELFNQTHLVAGAKVEEPPASRIEKYINTLMPEKMYSFDQRISELLNKLMRARSFDLIWIPAWQMIPYSSLIEDVPVFIDVMDDGVLELAREIRHSRSLWPLAVNVKRLFVTFLFERKYFSRAGWCCLVSEPDARVLRTICPRARVIVVPNGVDFDYFHPLGLPEEHPSLVFEGNMSFLPSIDAVRYFCSDIFPLIKAAIPKTKLYIVGKDPSDEIRSLASTEIVVTGFVEDIRPYVDRASVFICPMRKGAGIKNKLLQAWAMAKAVVATPVALAGLPAKAEKNILIARTASDFAAAVVRLLKDQSLRKRLGRGALELVRSNYGWERQARLIEAFLKVK